MKEMPTLKNYVKTQFDKDSRIKFVGTVYDQNELRYIREQAFAYLHGHEVGGQTLDCLKPCGQQLSMLFWE